MKTYTLTLDSKYTITSRSKDLFNARIDLWDALEKKYPKVAASYRSGVARSESLKVTNN